MKFPSLSLKHMPKPKVLVSSKKATSKLHFIKPCCGGFHVTFFMLMLISGDCLDERGVCSQALASQGSFLKEASQGSFLKKASQGSYLVYK